MFIVIHLSMARKRIPRSKLSKSGKYYRDNPDKAKKKAEYDTKYHDNPERRKYRKKLQRERVKRGIAGKGGGDLHHAKGGLKRESPSKNRGRNEKSRKKGYKKSKKKS
jgi:hypothetical protein